MAPVVIASVFARFRRRRHIRVALEPITDHVVIELLRPKQSGITLAHHIALQLGEFGVAQIAVKLVRFANAQREKIVKRGRIQLRRRLAVRRQSHPDRFGFARFEFQHVMRRRLGANVFGINCVLFATDDVFVESILDERAVVVGAEQSVAIGIIFREQKRRLLPRGIRPGFKEKAVQSFVVK